MMPDEVLKLVEVAEVVFGKEKVNEEEEEAEEEDMPEELELEKPGPILLLFPLPPE